MKCSQSGSLVSRRIGILPTTQRPRSRIIIVSQTGGGDDLMKKFEEERKIREEMDAIFKNAQSDLQSIAKLELDSLKSEAEEIKQRREEEWSILGAKEAEKLTSKVDSLAEQFLRSTGRLEDDAEEDADGPGQLAPPSVVAVVGEPGPLRDQIVERLTAQGVAISSCERLLETKGIRLEGTDAVVLCGDGEPLDRPTVERLLTRPQKLRRVVLLSTVGTERSDKFPFSLQNAFSGALDKKRGLEQGLIERSRAAGFAYTIIRIGKVARPDPANAAPELMPGDFFQEDTAADVAAEASLQALLYQPLGLNKSLSLISRRGPAATQDQWDDEFLKLDGPEIWRWPLGPVPAAACRDWLQESWAPRWIKKGNGLTTPVSLTVTPLGVQLVFKPPQSGFVSFKEERDRERARDRGDEPPPGAAPPAGPAGLRQLEGGVEVVVEERPAGRVRVLRCAMGEETVVKETSERILLDSLIKDVQAWAAGRR
uniref:NAD(P)-binding domain-containing protein n=1 Tax=Cryptomonas curvata TaxID=233186 RepID=A0A7S0MNM1_9CRYP